MILGVFWLLIANASAFLGAQAILDRLRTGKDSVDFLIFLLLRLALVSTAVLIGGMTGMLTPAGMGLLGVTALAGLLAGGVHRSLPRGPWPVVTGLMGIFAAAVLLRLVLQAWFLSPHVGDALAYHLPKIAEWIRAGRFTREMGIHPHVTFPAGFELVETWWVVFLRHDVLIEVAGVEFVVLAFAATRVLAESIGLQARTATLAALLFVTTPGLQVSATSCLNDVPAAALTLATFALVAARAPLPILLAAIGLGLGVKATTGFTLPGAALLAWLVRHEPALRPARGQNWGWAVGAAGLTCGAFWYARNAAWFANPFYPLGEQGIENPVAVQMGPQFASLFRNGADLFSYRIYDNRGAYGANVEQIAGWGATAFACGLPALLFGAGSDRRLGRLAAGFALALAVALLFVQNDPWCMKYVFFFPAVLCIAAARWAEADRRILALCAAATAFSFLATAVSRDLPLRDLGVLVRQPWRARSAAGLCHAEIEGEVVGCTGGFTANSYLLYGPDFSRRVVYLRSTSAPGLMDAMKRHGLRALYGAPSSPAEGAVLEECEQRGWLRRTAKHVYVID